MAKEKKETEDMPMRAIRNFLGDENAASKEYAKLGHKYHDPKLLQMAKDEKRHHAYWMKVKKDKQD